MGKITYLNKKTGKDPLLDALETVKAPSSAATQTACQYTDWYMN